jgi:hypothetical protein
VQRSDPVSGIKSPGPLIDVPDPRFSWVAPSTTRGAVQASYRIVVNRTVGSETFPAWDSGVVASAAANQVVYAGAALVSDAAYSWSVLWTDGDGVSAGWAEPATFFTGLLSQAEWAPADFITCAAPAAGGEANQLRAEFVVPAGAAGAAVAQARLYITGMGYYRAFVNGQRLGRNELDPAWTTYPQRLLYSGYDVLPLLSAPGSPSVLAVYLGNGWPNISPNNFNVSDGGDAEAAIDAAGEAAQAAYAAAHPRGAPVTRAAALRLAGGLPRVRGIGAVRKLRAQLRVTYSDGSSAVLVTAAASFRARSKYRLPSLRSTLDRAVARPAPARRLRL